MEPVLTQPLSRQYSPRSSTLILSPFGFPSPSFVLLPTLSNIRVTVGSLGLLFLSVHSDSLRSLIAP